MVSATKPLLMPALAIAVGLTAAGMRQSRASTPAAGAGLSSPATALPLLYAAIGLSWAGDVALMMPGDLWFVVGLGSFLLAHVAYLVLFIRLAGFGRPQVWSLVYAVWFLVFLVVLIPSLGSLVAPVVLYGLVLGAMAATATRVSPLVAVGAAAFVVSDTTLAVSRFLPSVEIPAHDVITMLTYCAAQGLIAWGVLALSVRANATSGARAV